MTAPRARLLAGLPRSGRRTFRSRRQRTGQVPGRCARAPRLAGVRLVEPWQTRSVRSARPGVGVARLAAPALVPGLRSGRVPRQGVAPLPGPGLQTGAAQRLEPALERCAAASTGRPSVHRVCGATRRASLPAHGGKQFLSCGGNYPWMHISQLRAVLTCSTLLHGQADCQCLATHAAVLRPTRHGRLHSQVERYQQFGCSSTCSYAEASRHFRQAPSAWGALHTHCTC
jgi:hypothetical protein